MRSPASVIVVALLLVVQLGSGTPLGRSADQIGRSVTRPIPQAPPTTVWRPDSVWVPDRYIPDPMDNRSILLPGHWERRLPDGTYYGPPVTICSEAGGTCATIPAGPRPAPEHRQSP